MATNPSLASDRFELIDEHQVLDRETNLIWTRKNVSDRRLTHAAAVEACEKLELCGHTDWRLPTRKELLTLVDDMRFDPAIDPIFECEPSWYWSATNYAPDGGYAWVVNFYYGDAYAYYRSGSGFVRAVRGGQF